MINKIIFITGTPGVGKTTIVKSLFSILKSKHNVKIININKLAIANNLIIGKDFEKNYKIVDLDKLNECLEKTIKHFFNNNCQDNNIIIVEGHLSHFCSNPDKVIVLRTNPNILQKRLLNRNYSNEKIKENLEAESLAICSNESYELHNDKVNEIDTSYLTTNETLTIILNIINNNRNYPPGKINYMNWLLEND